MQLLARSGTVRAERVADRLARWADEGVPAGRLHGGAAAVYGVVFMMKLDEAIREATAEARSLDDVIREMTRDRGETDLARLKAAVQTATGLDPEEVMPPAPAAEDEEPAAEDEAPAAEDEEPSAEDEEPPVEAEAAPPPGSHR